MKFKTILLLFFIIIVAIGGLFFYYKDMIFSKDFLKLEIVGQGSVKSGDEISYTVNYKNNSNFILKDAKLVFELPENSLTEDNKLRLTQTIKDIAPGEDGFVKFSAHLLGKEGDVKTARAWFSYVPENLSARYEGVAKLETTISESPVTLSFDLPSKMEQNKQVALAINYASDIDYPLENMSIKLQVPPGFTVTSSSPASLDKSEWKLPTLEKGKNGVIKITGIISGQEESLASFSARLGMRQDGSFVVIKEAKQDVQLSAPSLIISQTINNDSQYVAKLGEMLNYQVMIKNTGSASISGASILVKLSGRSFDISTLATSLGQVNIQDNSIVFDSQKNPALVLLAPNQDVSLNFSVKLKEGLSLSDTEVIKSKITLGDISQEFVNKVTAQ
jgi:hypothetical protein